MSGCERDDACPADAPLHADALDTHAAAPGHAPPPLEQAQLLRDLVRKHQRRLYNFVLRNIGNPSDAEELAQQAFVEAAASLRTFRGESELSSWLYGIAMNLVRNYLSRAPHRRYTIEDESVLETHASQEASPLQRLETDRLLQGLQKELDDLPAEMRDVLLLVAIEDLSYEEAALMLSIPIGTVRSRVSRARDTLRKKLAGHLPDVL